MSKRLRAAFSLLLLCLLAGASASVAQEAPPPRLDQVGRRIEALRPEVDEAARLVRLADRARADSVRAANQIPQDTVIVGVFEVVTVDGQGMLARDIFQAQVEEFARLIRGSEELFRDHTWVFDYGWWRRPIYVDAEVVHEVLMSRRYSRERLAGKVRRAMGDALLKALPEDAGGLADWAQTGSFLPPDDWSGFYREMVSTPSLAVRRCFEGDLRWCWEAVGLSDREGGDRDWYSPAERRRLVESRYEFWLWPEDNRLETRVLLVRGCLLLESDRACDLVLEGYPRNDWEERLDYRIPFSGAARGTLVAEALRIGGEGAFTRLVSQPEEPIKDRLVHAAGVPAETLMAEWRDRVLNARPNTQAGLLLSPAALVFWLILIIALATRSTRWRFG